MYRNNFDKFVLRYIPMQMYLYIYTLTLTHKLFYIIGSELLEKGFLQ
jgi:hypothetical protein